LPSSPSRALAVGPKAPQEAPLHREVYVQHTMDADRFKSVPVQRMKGAFATVSKPTPGPERIRISSRSLALWSSCAALDPQAMELQTSDRIDVDILELLACSEECQVSAAAAFLTIQAVLAGLSLAAGLVVFGAGGNVDVDLKQVLKLLEPGFGCLNLIFAELACVGNGLRCLRDWDKVVVSRAVNIEPGENAGEAREGLKRKVFHQAAVSTVRLATNAAFLVCCLWGSRSTVVLLQGGVGFQDDWEGNLARNLLAAQAALGVLALFFAASDLFELMAPGLSPSPVAGSTTLLDETTLESQPSGFWPQ